MALVDCGVFHWPDIPVGTLSVTTQSFLLDATGEAVAVIFQAPKAGNVRRFYFRTGTTTVGGTVDCRLETVGLTDGLPTGTLVATNTNSACVIGNGDDNVWKDSGAFTADAPVTLNQDLAAVIVVPVSFNGNILMNEAASGPNALTQYLTTNTTGVHVKQSRVPVLVVEYDDGSILPIVGIMGGGINPISFSSASSPDEYGNKFTLPFECRVIGVWGILDADGLVDVALYQGDSTVMETLPALADVDLRRTTAQNFFIRRFATPHTLSPNITYRLTYIPGATTVTINEYEYVSTAVRHAVTKRDTCHRCQRTDAGSWIDTQNTREVAIGLVIDQIHNGVDVVPNTPNALLVNEEVYFPALQGFGSPTTWRTGQTTLDAVGEKFGCMFQAPKSGTIIAFHSRFGVTTVGGDFDHRVETISAGSPSGSLWDTNTNAVVTVANSDDNVWKRALLTAGAVVAQGDFVAFAVVAPSGCNTVMEYLENYIQQFPVALQDVGGAGWTRISAQPLFVIEYSDGFTFTPGVHSFVPSAFSFNSGSAEDELGIRILMSATRRIMGGYAYVDANAEDYDLVVYDAAGNAVVAAIDSANMRLPSSFGGPQFFTLPTSITAAAGDVIRVTVRPQTTGAINIARMTFQSAEARAQCSGGTVVKGTARANAGLWTDSDTVLHAVGLMFDQRDNPPFARQLLATRASTY